MSDAKWHTSKFVWRELMTPDVEKAKGFYGELFGWTFQAESMGAFDYTMIHAVGWKDHIGGIVPSSAVPGDVPSCWQSYASVEDVDAASQLAKEHGGSVIMPPTDIPKVGRFAVLGDADGAVFTVFRAARGDGDMPEHPGLGQFCWETLSAKSIDAAKAFYPKVLGWSPVPGPGGIDCFAAGPGQVVADVQVVQGGAPPHWLTYAIVETLAAANTKVEKLGGKVFVPRIDIPEVGAIAVVADPFGAVIGLFEAPKA